MINPTFTWDAEANGYLSDSFTVEGRATVHIELTSQAPVVTLKEEDDGGWGNYGQTPKDADCYEIEITSTDMVKLRLATPVEVIKCYIL